jgi:LDH2 family malate/lactate/ureidoglycolate dehydrogenase
MNIKKNKITHRIKEATLQKFISAIFQKCKLSKKDADIVSNGLVRADMRGVWSHGVVRTSVYCNRILKKAANPKPNIKFKNIQKNIFHVDGNNGIGFVTSHLSMEKCIAAAKKYGVGIAGIYNSNHFGMAANYLEQATRNDCIAWVFTNASKALPPHGAMAPHFGTSPFAFGSPTNNRDNPFILDMASSSVARGKLKFAAQRGEKIPFGLALDKFGKPTNDGSKAFEGIMLPFGGMKGAGISWMMDIIAGIFTGANHSGEVKNAINDFSGPANVGHFMVCLKADLFQNKKSFVKKMQYGITKVRKLKRAKNFKEILYPGEPEYKKYLLNKKQGLSLTYDIVEDLNKLSKQFKIKSPFSA